MGGRLNYGPSWPVVDWLQRGTTKVYEPWTWTTDRGPIYGLQVIAWVDP